MLDKVLEFILNFLDKLMPCYVIHSYELGTFYRGGKLVGAIGPGLHGKIPLLDSYHKDNVMVDTMKIKEVNVTTLDGRTVTIGCEFDLRIVDIIKAINNTNDWRTNLNDICQGILSDTLEDLNWEDIRKKTTKNAIAKKIEIRAFEMGVTISNFNFTDKAISRVFKLFNDK